MTDTVFSAGPAGPVPDAEIESTIDARFREAALRHPDRVAVHGDGDDALVLTYAELAAAAGGVAAALAALPGAPGDRVGLCLPHGPRFVAAILGTLAAGRAYVPLDPSWPVARLAAMCAHAEVAAVLTAGTAGPVAAAVAAAAAGLPTGGATDADTGSPRLGDVPVVDVATVPGAPLPATVTRSPRDPAYVLYTSGSTGVPKGVAQSHRAVLHGVRNHVTNLAITPADRVGLITSFGFDMAVTDLFAAVLTGAASCTADVRTHGAARLADTLADRGVTVFHSTPTVFRHLADVLRSTGRRLPAMRAAVLGGEVVTADDVRAARELLAADCVLVNGYGATECSFAVQNHVRPGHAIGDRDGVVPIGRELRGYAIALTPHAEAPGADAGEITIVSEHVALGYWRDPARTAERFVDLPGGARGYRTGDLARRLADGTLVYLGRADRQVKIRGARVEPGEVEACLEAQPGVARAVVVPRGEAHAATLVAFVQPRAGAAGADIDASALRHALVSTLPEHLVPSAVTVVAELPLTATGKVDLGALPAIATPAALATLTVIAGPATPTEHVVHAAWCAALGLAAADVATSFFDLGGHSLLLGLVQQHVEAALGTRVALVDLLAHPTIRAQAAHLDRLATPSPDPQAAAAAVVRSAVADRMARRRASRTTGSRA